MEQDDELNELIADIRRRPNPPSILVENIWHKDAKNVYHARAMIERHYKGETYQMQLDSHMRVAPNWDTELIQMLHSCDAGEYSVLTAYAPSFEYEVRDNGVEVAVANPTLTAIRWFATLPTRMTAGGVLTVERNADWFVRPFEVAGFAGGFVFSHGHLLLNAGYSKRFDNIYRWEEPF